MARLETDASRGLWVGSDSDSGSGRLTGRISAALPRSPSSPRRPAERTQLEDPRAQWQREQESMLRDYLSVARDALSAQKEIYQVKEQRLRLAQQEYLQLHNTWRDKSTSQTSREFLPEPVQAASAA